MRRVVALLCMLSLAGGPVAWGAIATPTIQVHGRTVMRAQLLTNAAAVGNGEWIDVAGFSLLSIHITGITTATVEVDGSNEATRPADATHGIKINATDITANQMVFITANMRWLKVRVTAYTAGSVNAWLEAQVQ